MVSLPAIARGSVPSVVSKEPRPKEAGAMKPPETKS